jgi:hypothetical protein
MWMTLAMMVRSRLWLAGEVSEHRAMALMHRLIAQVRRGATHWALLFLYRRLVLLHPGHARDVSRPTVDGRPRLRP